MGRYNLEDFISKQSFCTMRIELEVILSRTFDVDERTLIKENMPLMKFYLGDVFWMTNEPKFVSMLHSNI